MTEILPFSLYTNKGERKARHSSTWWLQLRIEISAKQSRLISSSSHPHLMSNQYLHQNHLSLPSQNANDKNNPDLHSNPIFRRPPPPEERYALVTNVTDLPLFFPPFPGTKRSFLARIMKISTSSAITPIDALATKKVIAFFPHFSLSLSLLAWMKDTYCQHWVFFPLGSLQFNTPPAPTPLSRSRLGNVPWRIRSEMEKLVWKLLVPCHSGSHNVVVPCARYMLNGLYYTVLALKI